MCIEKEIAANTAAINALTAAVRQLLTALPSRLDGLDARSVIVDEVPREVQETPLTLADVRSVCVRAGQAGYTQAVVDFLASRGVKLLTELPPAQYPALLMMLAEKGVR